MTPTVDLLAGNSGTALPDLVGSPPSIGVGTSNPPVASDGCIATQIEWIYSKNGDEISGTVELIGTVNIPTIGFYKYEFSPVGSEEWMTIAAGNQPKFEEMIGVWNTEALIPGDYQLRLVVTDSQNETLPVCTVSVTIAAP